MRKFIVEREIPNAGQLTPSELQDIAHTSNAAISKLGVQYQWLESFVTADRIYCVHIAPDEETVRRHAKIGGFPANRIEEVTSVMDSATDAEG